HHQLRKDGPGRNAMGDPGRCGLLPLRLPHLSAGARNRAASHHQRRGGEGRLRRAMNVDYQNLERDLVTGLFRQSLIEELVPGFRQMLDSGERLHLASYYASQIAEIVNRGAIASIDGELAYNLYQE